MYRKDIINRMTAVEQEWRVASVLIQRLAARQHVPSEELEDAHVVRDYRNAIVHGGDTPAIPIPEARAALCKFFGRMPPQW